MKEIVIGKNDAGQRVDRFLGKVAPLLPESLLQKYLRLKRVKRNGKPVKRDERLSEGDVLALYIGDEFFERPTEDNAWRKVATPRLDILYEDENLLLLDKKPGVLCHAAGSWDGATLLDHLRAYLYQKGDWDPRAEQSFTPSLANRIDRNTGGIVLAAKNAETLRILDEKIRLRELDKRYLAVVHGLPKPPEGVLRGYLFKDAKENRVYVRQRPEKGAKTAETRYRTLRTGNGLALLECTLLTGRTHQIRAQLAAAGHPLVGDGKYGRDKKGAAADFPGQALCSYRLTFAFKTDPGLLAYLQDKTFTLPEPAFVSQLLGR